MAVTSRVIDAPPERVFAVLSDGWTYSDWVVGTVHVRDVDATFPAVGAMIHHKAGPWPLSLHDASTVLACEPNRLLVLRAGLKPFGDATVRLRLEPVGGSATRVEMAETFASGPLHWLHTKLTDVVLDRRNVEALRRLDDIVRHAPHAGRADGSGTRQG